MSEEGSLPIYFCLFLILELDEFWLYNIQCALISRHIHYLITLPVILYLPLILLVLVVTPKRYFLLLHLLLVLQYKIMWWLVYKWILLHQRSKMCLCLHFLWLMPTRRSGEWGIDWRFYYAFVTSSTTWSPGTTSWNVQKDRNTIILLDKHIDRISLEM